MSRASTSTSHRLAAWLLLLGATLGACDELPGRPSMSDLPVDPATVTDFDVLYDTRCSGCHGADGTLGAARPLADPLYLAFIGKERFADVVNQGVPGTLMPGFGVGELLTDAQITALVDGAYARWASSTTPDDLPPYEAAAMPAAQLAASVTRGRDTFQAACSRCHDGGGDVIDPAYLALVSDQSVRTTIVCGRPDLDKPDWRHDLTDGALTEQQIADLTNWLTSHRVPFPGQPYTRSAQQRIDDND